MTRGTILVVDDSPLTIEAVRRGLEATGFAVRSASDLADVPRPLRRGEVDLVLLDVEMAEVFGDDLAMVLREEAGPPIYLLSALEEGELAERAAAAGVDGFIHKYAGVDAVVERVEAILGAPVAPAARVGRELVPLFCETARRRTRHARAAIRAGFVRQAAYELHALVGEAAVIGLGELARLAQDGRHAVAAGERQRGEDILSAIEAGLDSLGPIAPPVIHPTTGRKILLVDDSDLYRATMRAFLEEAGHAIVEAASLAECRALLPGLACDLVLLDLELHDGSGVEVIPEVRRALPRAGVVVLSGGDVMALPEHVDLALLKTLDPTTVLQKLERVLAERDP